MPTTIELPNCSVAIVNKGPSDLVMVYNQHLYEYKIGTKPKIVPFAVAHKHFGFELRGNKLFRNTSTHLPDGDETAYYVARATFLPWGWQKQNDIKNIEHIANPEDPPKEQVTKAAEFLNIKRTWESGIEARLVSLPAEISVEEYAELPQSL